jgi:hypothetical protein
MRAFEFSFLKVVWAAMVFFTSAQKTYMISFKKWKDTITNGMTGEEQKQLFYKYAIPESKLVIRDAFRSEAKIDFKRNHAPLLFISGSCDQLISDSLVFENYKKYKTNNSITDFKAFTGRNHLVFDHPAWKEETDFIIYWLQGI